MMERVASKAEMRAAIAEARREGKTVGFVPTMGALHEGHLSLVHAACTRTAFVAVSIFVNPLQFAPGEDFERYPRDLEHDLELLLAEGVGLVLTPTPEEMYGDGPQATVDPGPLASRWEGEVRPGHFRGVATVVTKLLNTIRPDLAFFGEKDYQQLRMIERLVRDLDIGVGVVGVPTVRDSDGLALSSRNAYLTPEDRATARGIPEALEVAAQELAWGERDASVLGDAMWEAAQERGVGLDYAAVVDAATLEPLECVDGAARAIIAGRIGQVRLIDNCALSTLTESTAVSSTSGAAARGDAC